MDTRPTTDGHIPFSMPPIIHIPGYDKPKDQVPAGKDSRLATAAVSDPLEVQRKSNERLAALGWQSSAQSAYEAAVKAGKEARAQGLEPKPMIIEFTAPGWCPHCQDLEAKVLPSPEVTEALKNYNLVRIDVDDPKDELAKALITNLKIEKFPTLVVIDVSDGSMNERGRISGNFAPDKYAGYINKILSWAPATGRTTG